MNEKSHEEARNGETTRAQPDAKQPAAPPSDPSNLRVRTTLTAGRVPHPVVD